MNDLKDKESITASESSYIAEVELLASEQASPAQVGHGALSSVPDSVKQQRRFYLTFLVLPALFLTVTLFGGLRLDAGDGSFIFVRPALVCLVFAAILMLLFFRARLVEWEGWFSEEYSTVENVAASGVMLTLFFASAQLFNSLLPEAGLPFLVVGFCFFWTLWNSLFADFDTRKLLRSLGALFGLAFVVKYLILSNLTAPSSSSWLHDLIQNPAKESLTWLLDLPRFAAGTGYIQFFVAGFYLLGLYLLPPRSPSAPLRSVAAKGQP